MELSVVIPMYNEKENVLPLYRELKEVLDSMSLSYEIIFVDDGSFDGTYEILKDIKDRDENVCVIRLKKNFGQTAALSCGLDYARGRLVVTMDGDLQNDPHDIPKMMEKLDDCDIVCGWRKERKDPFFSRKLPSMVANWLISHVTGVKLHDYGCTLKLFKREIFSELKLYGDMHRFIPALATVYGARIVELPVNHRPRVYGESKYGLSRIFSVILDLFTLKFFLSYFKRPMRFFGAIGILLTIVGFLISFYLSLKKILFHVHIGQRPALILGVLFILFGTQLFMIGLVSEILLRIYHESSKRTIYVVEKVLR